MLWGCLAQLSIFKLVSWKVQRSVAFSADIDICFLFGEFVF